jgi:hypothetical protein
MVKNEPSQTKHAIRLREQYAQAKAAKGPKLSKPLIPPPQDAAPATRWKQHHSLIAYFGRPDGKVWSAKLGRILKGSINIDGYGRITIDGKPVLRSRFNLSLSLGRAIKEGMECDHIVAVSRGGGDDWANLQELTGHDHRRKTALDNPDAGKKSGITRSIPIIARHVATGVQTRFDSVNEVKTTLGIHNNVIARSLNGETIRGDYVFSCTPEHLAEQADLAGEKWLEAFSSLGVLPSTKVSDRGRIQDSRGRRSYGFDSSGYKAVRSTIDGRKRHLMVHDVVTRTFHGPPPSSEHTPDHINQDSSDNRAENLRWATSSEQNRNKSTNRSVVQLDADTGVQLAVFGTIVEAAEAVNISATSISKAAGGLGLTAGFKWRFESDHLQ